MGVRPFWSTGHCSYNPRIFRVISITERRGGSWVEALIAGADPLRFPVEQLPAWLAAGASIDSGQVEQLQRLSAQALLMARALRMLERRKHFESELKRKLYKPGQDESLTAAVLARCRELGYLDDGRALKMALEFFSGRGGIGPMRLRQLLFERGCPAGLVDRAISEFSEHFDEGAESAALLEKRRRHFELKLQQLRRRLKARQEKAAALEPAMPRVVAANDRGADLRAAQNERRDQQTLRQQLAASVLAFLNQRGLSGEAGRRQARRLVDELLSAEEGGAEE
jgi:regulatory protein